jgi:hypothetical protein
MTPDFTSFVAEAAADLLLMRPGAWIVRGDRHRE